MTCLQLLVFGRRVDITRRGQTWYPGDEGIRRSARDLVVPGGLSAQEIPLYLADLCHEWARGTDDGVLVLSGEWRGTQS